MRYKPIGPFVQILKTNFMIFFFSIFRNEILIIIFKEISNILNSKFLIIVKFEKNKNVLFKIKTKGTHDTPFRNETMLFLLFFVN